MTLETQKKLAGHILRLLKVSYIDFPLGRTNKGNLTIRFGDSGDFTMFLDSVPLPIKDTLQDENNIELKRMLEKYWFEESQMTPMRILAKTIGPDFEVVGGAVYKKEEGEVIKKHLEGARKGRPVGSKNKPKGGD